MHFQCQQFVKRALIFSPDNGGLELKIKTNYLRVPNIKSSLKSLNTYLKSFDKLITNSCPSHKSRSKSTFWTYSTSQWAVPLKTVNPFMFYISTNEASLLFTTVRTPYSRLRSKVKVGVMGDVVLDTM